MGYNFFLYGANKIIRRLQLLFIVLALWATGCSGEENEKRESEVNRDSLTKPAIINETVVSQKEIQDTVAVGKKGDEALLQKGNESPKVNPEIPKTGTSAPVKSLEETMQDMGLVNVRSVEPSIKVDLKYTTTDNFMGKDAYGDLNDCYLQKAVAEMLKKAHQFLQEKHNGYHFIVYDGARPFTVQKKMWDIVKGTDKAHYVAKPDAKGSMHNYGCAVDLSVLDEKGVPLDMGTPFDFLGTEARTDIETDLLKQGKITQKQLDNRLILREAMEKAGFKVLKREWWHFNAFPDGYVLANYKKIP